MKKGKQVLDLYGYDFVVINPKNPDYIPRNNYSDIWHAYGRPSNCKQGIWCRWLRWWEDVKRDANGGEIYITSRNTNFFSIGGYIDSPIGERWAFLITSTRQECWKVCDI